MVEPGAGGAVGEGAQPGGLGRGGRRGGTAEEVEGGLGVVIAAGGGDHVQVPGHSPTTVRRRPRGARPKRKSHDRRLWERTSSKPRLTWFSFRAQRHTDRPSTRIRQKNSPGSLSGDGASFPVSTSEYRPQRSHVIGLPDSAREWDLLQPPLMQHPEPEAVIILVPKQDLNRLREGPGHLLQVTENPCPVGSPEVDRPRVHARDGFKALVPFTKLVGLCKRLHHLSGSESDDYDFATSTHARHVRARVQKESTADRVRVAPPGGRLVVDCRSAIDRNLVDDLAVRGGHHDVRRLHGLPLVAVVRPPDVRDELARPSGRPGATPLRRSLASVPAAPLRG